MALCLWETNGMKKRPEVDEIVFMDGKGMVRFIVTAVHAEKQTAILSPDVRYSNS